MTSAKDIAKSIFEQIHDVPTRGIRKMVAIAGPPASGKSTVSQELALLINSSGQEAQVVPMDGFHLDNAVLTAAKRLHRKGAPDTFDVLGFSKLMAQLATEPKVAYPIFDRALDASIPKGGTVRPSCDTVLVEGNYLLFDAPVWRDLREVWDFSVCLKVPESELWRRLVRRWLDHGLSEEQAIARAEENDLANARAVIQASFLPDMTIDAL
jgi:fructokinase